MDYSSMCSKSVQQIIKIDIFYLKSYSHTVVAINTHIDDNIQGDDPFWKCNRAVTAIIMLLGELGFVVHEIKCEILPKQISWWIDNIDLAITYFLQASI